MNRKRIFSVHTEQDAKNVPELHSVNKVWGSGGKRGSGGNIQQRSGEYATAQADDSVQEAAVGNSFLTSLLKFLLVFSFSFGFTN